jgi:hypothetical protein
VSEARLFQAASTATLPSRASMACRVSPYFSTTKSYRSTAEAYRSGFAFQNVFAARSAFVASS